MNRALNQRESLIEWPLWLSVLGLIVIGIAFVYSATSIYETIGFWQRFHDLSWQGFIRWLLPKLYARQLVAVLLGLLIATAFSIFSYHKLARWSFVVYCGGILLLAAVLIKGVGSGPGDVQRWINLGFFQVQPSELGKLAVVIGLANFLSRPPEELASRAVFFQALGMMGLPFLLILKEPDLGSALVLPPVGLAIMFVAGVPRSYLKKLVGLSVLLAAIVVTDVLLAPVGWAAPLQQYQRQHQPVGLMGQSLVGVAHLHDEVLEQYQRERLLVYFGREFASKEATAAERRQASQRKAERSYNTEQALISVGSGGWLGKGWGEGTQNKLGFLPSSVAHNDFIFSVIAEEIGFVGSALVLALYGILLFAGIKIASQARDRLGKLLAIGLVALFFSHIFINIGMNIRMMPVTGIPLPLLSYGGTSVVCTLIAAGILQNIHLYRKS